MKSFKETVIGESAVGMVGRTGAMDAKAHVTAELRAKFKKIVKELGGKTVARQLLAEMNAGGAIEDNLSENLNESAVMYGLLNELLGNLVDAPLPKLKRANKILTGKEEEKEK